MPLALSGHLEVVKVLVVRGADAACRDAQGYTPLHAAAAAGQVDVLKYLLQLGAEVIPEFPVLRSKIV